MNPIIDANAVEVQGQAFIMYALGFQYENFYGTHNIYHTLYTYEEGEIKVLYRVDIKRNSAFVVDVATGEAIQFEDAYGAYFAMRSLFYGYKWEHVVNLNMQQEVA